LKHGVVKNGVVSAVSNAVESQEGLKHDRPGQAVVEGVEVKSQEGLKLLTERGGFVAGVDSACPPCEVLPLGRPAASRRACTCLKLSEARWKGPARLGAPGLSPAFSPAVVELRRLSRRREPRHLLSTEISAAVGTSGGEAHADAAACL